MAKKKTDRRVYVLVTFELPDGATPDQAADYVERAVAAHKGGLDPSDPMFRLDGTTVEADDARRHRQGAGRPAQ